ncbi:MAG: DUF2959 family protein [Syntrophales bacterium]|nr:DUF2959 family protein [Syntrophales bacterium]
MKIKTKPAALFTTLLFGAIAFMGGCATTGMERSASTSTSMKTVESDIRQAAAQVDATGASLNELINPDQAKVKKAFDKYSDNVAKMEQMGKRLLKHTDEMSTRGKEYFEEWDKQGNTYKNPQIRELSEQRRADLGAIYAQIPVASVGVKGAFNAYLSDIKEIQKYLSNDLTPKGIESIAPVAQKAVSDGALLKEAVTPVLAAIDRVRAELATGGAK